MSVDYSKLAPGQKISDRTYVVDADMVSRYADAVDDRSEPCSDEDGRELAPPMAVAALSIRGVVNDLEIPGDTVHLGAEIKFSGPVIIGESVDCRASLARNSVRGAWRFMVLQLEVDDSRGQRVMDGRSTFMVLA